jgi:hypothetical protein
MSSRPAREQVDAWSVDYTAVVCSALPNLFLLHGLRLGPRRTGLTCCSIQSLGWLARDRTQLGSGLDSPMTTRRCALSPAPASSCLALALVVLAATAVAESGSGGANWYVVSVSSLFSSAACSAAKGTIGLFGFARFLHQSIYGACMVAISVTNSLEKPWHPF